MTLLLSHFVDAMNDVFRKMIQQDLVNGPIEEHQGEKIHADVSAHLPLMNDQEACLVITVPEAIAVEMVRTISGRQVAFEDSLISDTVGEILNMIVGKAQKVGKFQFSLPVIARGRAHEVRILSAGRSRRVLSALTGGAPGAGGGPRGSAGSVGLYLVSSPSEAAEGPR